MANSCDAINYGKFQGGIKKPGDLTFSPGFLFEYGLGAFFINI
jgi:hypothetical protein